MVEEIRKGGFDYYLRFAKPLIINLPAPTDRILAAAWIRKLCNSKNGNEELRTNYLKLLLFVLQRKRLIGPFRENPNTSKDLEEFPANLQVIDIAQSLLQADEGDRRDRLRGLIAAGGGDFPPFNIECSADLLEYAAAQDIPKFGVHAYYAISNSPITTWDNVDFNFLPKGISLDKAPDAGGLAAAASSPEVLTKSHVSMSDSRSKSRSRATKQEKSSKDAGKGARRGIPRAVPPAKSPLGSQAPVDDRDPPTWGSNLIEVTDPPDETAFNLSLAAGINYAEFNDLMTADETDLETASSHVMQRSDARSAQRGLPRRIQPPTNKFVRQFKNISILPGTEKSQDIINEVNESLLQSGRELSLSEAEAEIDARYPQRRTDMPRTPPKLSRHRSVREAGRGIQYSPQQFDLSDEEYFTHGPSVIEGQQHSPREQVNVRADLRHDRAYSSTFKDIEGDDSFEAQAEDFLVDDIAEQVEEAIRTPKNVKRKLRELLNEIEVMKESTPALGGVPVTTPKRSPSPSRKMATTEFNIADELALFTEAYPDLLGSDFLDSSAEESPQKKSPYASPQQPQTPTHQVAPGPSDLRTPPQQTESLRTRAARLRPESPPTPEKPDYEEYMRKTGSARSFLRPRTFRVRPTSTSREIKLFSKPVKHYKQPAALHNIDESPEYRKKTTEDRFYDLYDQLIAEDRTGQFTSTPPHSVLPPALDISPLSPITPIEKYFHKIIPHESKDEFEGPDLYDSPVKVSPLKDLNIPEQFVEEAPHVFEDVQFNFDYNPIDLGATAAMENLYEGDVFGDTPPPIPGEDLQFVFGSPLPSPTSPAFYERENILTPQEFQDAIEEHEYTYMYRTNDPQRQYRSQLRTPRGGTEIPLLRHAPRPPLQSIIDKPMLEDILAERERMNPPAPRSPLTPGLPWRRELDPNYVRIEDMPQEVQEKLAEPVPQRELKDWEEFVFDTVIKPEDKDYFTKLFNEYNLIKDEMIHPDLIRYRSFREPRPLPPSPPRPPSPIPDDLYDTRFGFEADFFPKPEMQVIPPPQVQLLPDDIPDSWAVTQHLLDRAEMMKANIDMKYDGQSEEAGGLYADDGGLCDMADSVIEDTDVLFHSPEAPVPLFRPESPLTPEKPTLEELIANARAATKKKRPSKMTLGTPRGTQQRFYTRPLRHYEPLAYLDRIDESPHVSPEIDWQKVKADFTNQFGYLTTTPQLQPQLGPQRRMRGQPRINPQKTTTKPRKLKFTKDDLADIEYFPTDAAIDNEDRSRFNRLLATLPGVPLGPLPEDLIGQYYEHKRPEATGLIDRDIPERHLKQQQSALSPERTCVFLPKSPVAQPVSPPKIQNMYADPLYQEMGMAFPEEIEGEIERLPDPYDFMSKMPTRFEGFEEDLIPDVIGTQHEGFTQSPIRPMQQMPSTCTPVGQVTPTSPLGLDTFFETPPEPNLFDRYPDDVHTHEMWMEYEPVEYIAVGAYKMDTPPKPKSPPKPKTPPVYKPPTPRAESPLPVFISPDTYDQANRYTTTPSPFRRSPMGRTPPYPKYKYGLTPTRPSPYKESHTPPCTPPAFKAAYDAIEASPINFEDEPFTYFASPEYAHENIDNDFDFSFVSSESSGQATPDHLTATPPSKFTPPVYIPFAPTPPELQNFDNWDLEIQGGDSFDTTPELQQTSPVHEYVSPIQRTPPSPPQPVTYEEQEFYDTMASHRFTDRHASRDPYRSLATKMLRSSRGGKPFVLRRNAPVPTLPTIYDFDESPGDTEALFEDLPEIPQDVIWKTPETAERVPIQVPIRYDTCGYDTSPNRDFQTDFLEMIPKTVRRNLFDEFGDDSTVQDTSFYGSTTSPVYTDEAVFHSPKTPPRAFSPQFEDRMKRSLYDGSAPYMEYPEIQTPPSGSRRRMRTYTPPGGPSPVKPTREEIMENISESYATPTPHTMGVHSRTGYIKDVPTRPAQEYYAQRMPLIQEVGEQYLTPPSGLRQPRRTYTPCATPVASPRLASPAHYTPPTPPSGKRTTYTPPQPESPPSPHQWFSPTYTPPPHLRWSPLGTPSPPKAATTSQVRKSVKRQLFTDTPERQERTPRTRTPYAPYQHYMPSPSPEQSFVTAIGEGFHDESSDMDEFVSPGLSPSRIIMFEQEIVYDVGNAFVGQDEDILDTSDIPIMEDDDKMDFQWMN